MALPLYLSEWTGVLLRRNGYVMSILAVVDLKPFHFLTSPSFLSVPDVGYVLLLNLQFCIWELGSSDVFCYFVHLGFIVANLRSSVYF